MSIRALSAPPRARLGWLLLSPCLVGWLACSEVTEPTKPADAPAAAAVVQVPPQDASAEIDDVLDRVLPAMSDEAGSNGLEAAFKTLLDALSRGESGASMASVESAEQALEAFARGVGPADGDAAHVDVIALALASVRARVERGR